jgi:hypothetical protein
MTISIYDVNNFLKDDATLQSIAGKTMNFFPVIGYGTEAPPFVVYYFYPSIPSVEAFWNRYDNVRYSIYDSDADRLFKIAERFIYLLGRGDTVSQSGGIESENHRFKSSIFVGSSILEPLEKEGWYQMDLDFRIYSTSYA